MTERARFLLLTDDKVIVNLDHVASITCTHDGDAFVRFTNHDYLDTASPFDSVIEAFLNGGVG